MIFYFYCGVVYSGSRIISKLNVCTCSVKILLVGPCGPSACDGLCEPGLGHIYQIIFKMFELVLHLILTGESRWIATRQDEGRKCCNLTKIRLSVIDD